MTKQELNEKKNDGLSNKDVHFETKEEAVEFINKKFSSFKQETAGQRSAEGWHFDSHPLNNSSEAIEHINIYSKRLGFRVHITWGR